MNKKTVPFTKEQIMKIMETYPRLSTFMTKRRLSIMYANSSKPLIGHMILKNILL